LDNDLLCSRRDLESLTHRKGDQAPQDKDLYSSSVMTDDQFIRPSACFSFYPILSRNPVDLDNTELSHKRQQGYMSKAPIRLRDPEWLHFPSSKRCFLGRESILREMIAPDL
jgi:hypothetical protein